MTPYQKGFLFSCLSAGMTVAQADVLYKSAGQVSYIIQPGDTWESLGQRTNWSPESLRKANASKTFAPGTKIYLPTAPTPVAKPKPVVKPKAKPVAKPKAKPVAAPKANPTVAPAAATPVATAPAAPATPAAPVVKTETRTGPIGYRQKNPGNLRSDGKTRWQGADLPASGKFLTFDTDENGVRALARTLYNYGNKHGVSTVEDTISRYAPSSENDTSAYTKYVLDSLGLKPNETIDLTDEDFLQKIVPVIGKREIGGSYFGKIDPAVVSNGVKRAIPAKK